MRTFEYGDRALLIEVDDPRTVPDLRAALAAVDGVVDAVAGARTVLVDCGSAVPDRLGEEVRRLVGRADLARAVHPDPLPIIEMPVVYDGPDLDEVAAEVGAGVDEVVSWHSAPEYTVRFCGFAPGFAYLDGLDERLHLPRRSEPRTKVPAGSVGIAGEFSGVYPRSSPGGWRLLGRTDLMLWDADRDPPALLVPGTPVRFVPS